MSTAATTYVIAEAGSCGDADLSKMLSMIDDAKAIGADAVKFQWTTDPTLMALQRGTAFDNGYVEVYGKYIQWDQSWHETFAQHCQDAGLDYLCTVYLADDIPSIAPYVARFKVASFEATDCNFIQAHAPFASSERDVLISTGMCSATELGILMKTCIEPVGMSESVKFLHCTSAYPAPFNQLNLSAIQSNGESWQIIGFSDHSLPELTHTGALAVTVGAKIIEAHLRSDDTNPKNPDYDHAMTTDQFLSYIAQIRMVEDALGSGVKESQECEEQMKQYRVRS